MAHVYRFPSPAAVVFSSRDKIVLNGADHWWECDIRPDHVLVDVLTCKVTSFSSDEARRMMAEGEMIVFHNFHCTPS